MLFCEDPDVGNPPPFVHWVVYNIPASAKGLPEPLPIDPSVPLPAGLAGAGQTPRFSGNQTARRRRAGNCSTRQKGHVVARGELVATDQRQ